MVKAPEPVHGRLSTLRHSGHPLFKGIPSGPGFDVVRRPPRRSRCSVYCPCTSLHPLALQPALPLRCPPRRSLQCDTDAAVWQLTVPAPHPLFPLAPSAGLSHSSPHPLPFAPLSTPIPPQGSLPLSGRRRGRPAILPGAHRVDHLRGLTLCTLLPRHLVLRRIRVRRRRRGPPLVAIRGKLRRSRRRQRLRLSSLPRAAAADGPCSPQPAALWRAGGCGGEI